MVLVSPLLPDDRTVKPFAATTLARPSATSSAIPTTLNA
jgi:hypothetical protein